MNQKQNARLTRRRRLVLAALLLLSPLLAAETLYIDDKIKVGLHQEKSVDSPILKVLSGGAALEVIKRDTPLTQVKDADGANGWIDNRYLATAAPGRAQLVAAEEKIKKLEAEVAGLKTGSSANTATTGAAAGNDSKLAAIAKENDELKQLLKSERLRVGELQAQTAELRNKLDKANDNSGLLEQLDALTRDKTELQNQISVLQAGKAKISREAMQLDIGEFDWEKMLISIGISLAAGFIVGLYVLDLIVRRRHGGFRV